MHAKEHLVETTKYLPEVKAVPLAAPKVDNVTAKGIKNAAVPKTRCPNVYCIEEKKTLRNQVR